MEETRLAGRNIVLMGIGHTNAHIVRMWGMHSIPDTSLTCISNFPFATYSGMLPAVLAGLVPKKQMQIDLVRLCASVGARLILDKPAGLDRKHGLVHFRDRPALPYDALSIGIGSVPVMRDVTLDEYGGEALVKIKPMQTFLGRLEQRLSAIRETGQSVRALVVGSGLAGIEILFCLTGFLRGQDCQDFEIALVSRSEQVLDGSLGSTRAKVEKEIQRRGHPVYLNRSVKSITGSGNPVLCEVSCSDGSTLQSNLVIWATGATGPPGVDGLDLPLDERGFVQVDRSLQTVDHARYPDKPIFVVGDTGTIESEQLPKAGVYAVRQGPILWDNLHRVLDAQPLRVYQPQRSFLRLINRGDGTAVGEWKGLSFSGRWAYRLKDYIDSSFMKKYEPVTMPEDSSEPMQCHGCGCKLEPTILRTALQWSENESGSGSSGGFALEDAAEVGRQHVSGLLASTDFFTNPVDDPFLFGRIAAVHAASDILASGATPTEALANVVVPGGSPESQQEWVSDFLVGATREFERIGATIVGGHTIVGPRAEAGFTVIGKTLTASGLQKSALELGSRLYLTKPIGIGLLLAAHMRAKCPGHEYLKLIDLMLQPQEAYARIACELGIRAATDVTGFGLAGHLMEMLEASRVNAAVCLREVPMLAPALELAEQGVESSLLAGNLSASSRVEASEIAKESVEYRLLFDPQTCGGLLFGVPESVESEWLSQLQDAKLASPAKIGVVVAADSGANDCLIRLS